MHIGLRVAAVPLMLLLILKVRRTRHKFRRRFRILVVAQQVVQPILVTKVIGSQVHTTTVISRKKRASLIWRQRQRRRYQQLGPIKFQGLLPPQRYPYLVVPPMGSKRF